MKGEKEGRKEMKIGVKMEKKKNETGVESWTLTTEKYVKAAIENVEERIGELPHTKGQCPTPMRTNYHHSEDISPELNAEVLAQYQ